MSQCKDPRSCKSQLRGWSTMIFHTVIILQLTHINGGESPANSQHRMLAVIGHTQSITLPCSIHPATDVVDEMVEWSRSDLNPRFVHVRRSGEDHMFDQNPSYKERTSMSVNGLKMGDASLKLTKVRLSDEGTYRCFVPGLKTDFSVELVVADIQITKVSPGVLECKSEGWYPEPEVLWLESERKLLSAGSKETFRGPDDLCTLSSRLTLEKGHSNNFTCRIQQNNLQREATIYVPGDFFVKSSSSTRSVIGLIAGIMFVSAVLFLVWKWRKNKMENKKSSKDGESQCSSSKDPETKPLMKNTEECKGGSEAVMNQEKVDVNDPAHTSKQHGLSCENKHSERQQNNDQAERDTTNEMCSDEKTKLVDKRPPLGKLETHPEPGNGNTEKLNQCQTNLTNPVTADTPEGNLSEPNSSKGEETEEEQDNGQDSEQPDNNEEKESVNTSATDEGPDGGDQQEENSTESKDAISGLQDQNNDGNGEITQTGENKTTNSTDESTTHNDHAVGGEIKNGQDATEKSSKPQPDTQPSHPEENGTNQVPPTSRTEQPNIKAKESVNTSATDEGPDGGDQQEGNSTESKDPISGLEDQNNDGNGEITQTGENKTTDSTDESTTQNDHAVGGEIKNGQDATEKSSKPQPDTQPSHPEENGTNQVPPTSRTEQPNIKEKESVNTSATDEGPDGGDQQEGNSTESKDPISGLEDQNNDDNLERKQTGENKTTDSTDESTSQDDHAVGGESQNGQDATEKSSKPQPDTQPSHPEENGTNQVPPTRTEQPNIKEKESGTTSATDDSSVNGDQQQQTIKSQNATSDQEAQNNDTNGEQTEATTVAETADSPGRHVSPTEGEEAKKGQEEDSKPKPGVQPTDPDGTNQKSSGNTEQPESSVSGAQQ
ncbi:uncharacterized protein DDB_G0290685-like isoform X2 [Archocentrus centrarchus]|uniref:uncharacterized protein DDB_G0290685-like isoform X2 n=1 Tax=Archocentrus centrarchus TaxID=63155 RepID=UPI0011EA4502|nr:uncharacterized protein DDB_G0290685-like isoform X2 [Archocentrus centrarchus]